jgi:hypothetical protein
MLEPASQTPAISVIRRSALWVDGGVSAECDPARRSES